MTLLPQSPECWDQRPVTTHLASSFNLWGFAMGGQECPLQIYRWWFCSGILQGDESNTSLPGNPVDFALDSLA